MRRRARAFWTRLVDQVRTLSGVTAVGLTSNVPFNGMVGSGSYTIVGYNPPQGEAQPHGRQEIVGGDYFRAMQIPLVAGRLFTDADTADEPEGRDHRSVSGEALLRGQEPARPADRARRADQSHRTPSSASSARSTASTSASRSRRSASTIRSAQQPNPAMGLIVKTRIDPQTLAAQVRAAVAAIDPEQPMADVRTMDEWMARSLEGRRAPMLLLALFGAVALTLVGDRHLRRAGVRRGAARARVRHPPGARRRARAPSWRWCSGRACGRPGSGSCSGWSARSR